MIDMTHRANIDVRLVPLKLRLAHCYLRLSGICGLSKNAGSVAAQPAGSHLNDTTFFSKGLLSLIEVQRGPLV
jgi:hypothetical protein